MALSIFNNEVLSTISHVCHLLELFLLRQTKKDAHRFYAVLTQLGVKSCELHGDVSQALRYLALQRFRDNEVDVMVRSFNSVI